MPNKNFFFADESCIENVTKLFKAYTSAKEIESRKLYHIDDLMFHPVIAANISQSKIPHNLVSKIADLNWKNTLSDKHKILRDQIYQELSMANHIYQGDMKYKLLQDPSKYLSEFEEALHLINIICDWQYQLLINIIKDVWFIQKNDNPRFLGGGVSDYNYLGMIFMSFRPKKEFHVIDLAVAIVHEIGHNVLFLYQAGLNPIQKSSWEKQIYSGVRKTNRPSYASMHAAMALAYMFIFCKEGSKCLKIDKTTKNYLSTLAQEHLNNLKQGLKALNELEFTELGNYFIEELSSLS